MNFRLKEMRESRGLSQGELAHAIDEKIATYGTWERGERMLSFIQAARIADVLDCTLDELAGRKPPQIAYADYRQNMVNACFDGMREESKDALLRVAESMKEKDDRSRVVKDREERMDNGGVA